MNRKLKINRGFESGFGKMIYLVIIAVLLRFLHRLIISQFPSTCQATLARKRLAAFETKDATYETGAGGSGQ